MAVSFCGCEEEEQISNKSVELSFNIGNQKCHTEARADVQYYDVRYFIYTFEIDDHTGFGFTTNEIIISKDKEMYLNMRLFFDSEFEIGKRYYISDVINEKNFVCLSNYVYLTLRNDTSRDYFAKDGWIEFVSLEDEESEYENGNNYFGKVRFEFTAEDDTYHETIQIKNGTINAYIKVTSFCPAAYLQYIE